MLGVRLPQVVRALPWKGLCSPGGVLAGAMVVRALHVLDKPMVVHARRVLASSKPVCVRRKFVESEVRDRCVPTVCCCRAVLCMSLSFYG